MAFSGCSKDKARTGTNPPTEFPAVSPFSGVDRYGGRTLPIRRVGKSLPALSEAAGVPPVRAARSRKPLSAPLTFPLVRCRLPQVARTRARCAFLRPSGPPSPSPARPAVDLSALPRALNSLRSEFLPQYVPSGVRRALFTVLEIVYFLRDQVAPEQSLRFCGDRCERFFQMFAVPGDAHYANLRPLP